MNNLFKRFAFLNSADIILIKRAIRYITPYKWMFISAFICLLLNILFGLLHPWLTAKIVTSVFSQNFPRLLKITSLMAGVAGCAALIQWLQSYLYLQLNEKIVYDIKNDMYQRIINLPVEAFDHMRVGEFISRLNGDAGTIAHIITQQFVGAAVDIVKVIVIGIVIFKLSWQLTVAIILCLPISYLIFVITGKKLRKHTTELMKIQDSYYSNVQETMMGIREVKSLGIKRTRLETFFSLGLKMVNQNIKVGVVSSTSGFCAGILNIVTELIVIVFGFFLTTINKFTIEGYIAYMYYNQQFIQAVMNATQINSSIQQALVALGRIFELMDSFSYKPDTFGKLDFTTKHNQITFRNVNFNYVKNKEVLKGISFDIPAGSTTAIVGHSGSGKSTIFNLILRLYDPTQGEVLINGINLSEFAEDSLRKNISVVRQEPFLFKMTIKENLLLAAPNASNTEIQEACQTACIHEDIMKTRLKYDTTIGENGVTLSVGQKQRIAIARALLKKSQIILFDEATSSLDNESQSHIQKALKNLSHDKTILIIAHRLSTIIDANLIFVINDGKVAGVGTHEGLFENNSIYKKLYEKEIATNRYLELDSFQEIPLRNKA